MEEDKMVRLERTYDRGLFTALYIVGVPCRFGGGRGSGTHHMSNSAFDYILNLSKHHYYNNDDDDDDDYYYCY